MNTQKIKKAAGYGSLGIVLAGAIVVGVGRNMAAWPGNVDAHIDTLNMKTSSIEKDVEDLEEDSAEQKEINKKMGDEMEKMSTAQHKIATEQAVQGTDIKHMVKILERMEDDR